jgi:hypothetical protein
VTWFLSIVRLFVVLLLLLCLTLLGAGGLQNFVEEVIGVINLRDEVMRRLIVRYLKLMR